MIHALLVDDDAELRTLVSDYLQRYGLRVTALGNGAALKHTLTSSDEAFDVLLLDLMLPDANGLDLCRWLRASSTLPVIMLTAQGDPASRIVGLELGADDYLPKTFSSRELLARLRALLRRTGWIAETAPLAPIKEIVVGELRINPETHAVVLGAEIGRASCRERV